MLRHRLATLGLVTALCAYSTAPVVAQNTKLKTFAPITLTNQTTENQAKLYAFGKATSEAVVLVTVTGTNIVVQPAQPCWHKLSRNYDDPVVVINQAQPGPWHYDSSFRYSYGVPGARPQLQYIYQVPFKKGQPTRITRGNKTESHGVGSINEYALDFDAQIGTTVCAAREGVVIASRWDSTEGGPDASYLEAANFVIIKHADGTYAEYAHLQTNGVLVKVNEIVKKGQPIGLSGNTGQSTGPHLHFCVFYKDANHKRHSLPIYMMGKHGIVNAFAPDQDF